MSNQARHVYVMYSDNQMSKIGISKDVERRKKELQRYDGDIDIVYCSPLCMNAYEIEQECLERFKYASRGEWIKVDSPIVVDWVRKTFEERAILADSFEVSKPIVSKIDIGEYFAVKSTRTDLMGMTLMDVYYACCNFRNGNFDYYLVMAFTDGKVVKRILIDENKIMPYGDFTHEEYSPKGCNENLSEEERFMEWSFHHLTLKPHSYTMH